MEKYLQSGIISCSISRVQRDHSICTAVMGWTACALLIVSGLASDNPMYLIFPSCTSFFSSPICHLKKTQHHINHRVTTWTSHQEVERKKCLMAHSQCPRLVLRCQHGADNTDQCSSHQGVRGFPRNRIERIQENRPLSHYSKPFSRSQTWWQSEFDLEASPWAPER